MLAPFALQTSSGFVAPSRLSTVLFVVLLLAVQVTLVVAALRAGGRGLAARTAGLQLAVGALLGCLVIFVFDEESFLPVAAAFAGQVVLTLALAFSRTGLRFGWALPPAAWLLLMSFRLPLELLLHRWGEVGTVPPQMTWSGQNLDVAAGVLSLAGCLVLLARPSKPLAIGCHIVGLALLLNVIRVALTSLPSPLRAFDQVLYLPYHLPFALILPFAVMTALFVHIVALRALVTGEGEARADFERISESV